MMFTENDLKRLRSGCSEVYLGEGYHDTSNLKVYLSSRLNCLKEDSNKYKLFNKLLLNIDDLADVFKFLNRADTRLVTKDKVLKEYYIENFKYRAGQNQTSKLDFDGTETLDIRSMSTDGLVTRMQVTRFK